MYRGSSRRREPSFAMLPTVDGIAVLGVGRIMKGKVLNVDAVSVSARNQPCFPEFKQAWFIPSLGHCVGIFKRKLVSHVLADPLTSHPLRFHPLCCPFRCCYTPESFYGSPLNFSLTNRRFQNQLPRSYLLANGVPRHLDVIDRYQVGLCTCIRRCMDTLFSVASFLVSSSHMKRSLKEIAGF